MKNLTSFSSSLEQYKQSINAFDGLEANSAINEFVEYERLADRPAWVFWSYLILIKNHIFMIPFKSIIEYR